MYYGSSRAERIEVFNPLTLTTDFVASSGIEVGKFSDLVLSVSSTGISGTNAITLKTEWSGDESTWRQATGNAYSAGVNTKKQLTESLADNGTGIFSMPVLDRYVRISAKKATDVATTLRLTIGKAILGQ